MNAGQQLLCEAACRVLDDLAVKASRAEDFRSECLRLEDVLRHPALLQTAVRLSTLVEHDDSLHHEAMDEHTLLDLVNVLGRAEALITCCAAPLAPPWFALIDRRRIARGLRTAATELKAYSTDAQGHVLGLRQRVHSLGADVTGDLEKVECVFQEAAQQPAPVPSAPQRAPATTTPIIAEALRKKPAPVMQKLLKLPSEQPHRAKAAWPPHSAPSIPDGLRRTVFQHLEDMVPNVVAHLPGTPQLAIAGVAGLGKTTIARAVLETVRARFDLCVFVVVGQQPHLTGTMRMQHLAQVLQEAWRQMFPEHAVPYQTHRALFRELVLRSRGQNLVVVFDDVWNEADLRLLNFASPQEHGAARHCVLATTRVSAIFDEAHWRVEYPAHLTHEYAEQLLRWHAFREGTPSEGLQDATIQQVVRKCKGLPLMLEVTGASLRGKDAQAWMKRLQELSSSDKVPDLNDQLRARVRTSVDVLPPFTKRCFTMLAAWPEDATLKESDLTEQFQWICPFPSSFALEWAQQQVHLLHSKSLLTSKPSGHGPAYTMHDILHDVAVAEARKRPHVCCCNAAFEVPPRARMCVHSDAHTLAVSTDTSSHVCLNARHVRWVDLEAPACVSVEGLQTCNQLRHLRVHGCQFNALDRGFSTLRVMRVLKLQFCVNLTCLPASIDQLVHLEELSMDSCFSLQCLPASVGCLHKLVSISLQGCKALSDLPDTITNLTALQTLLLDDCYSLSLLPTTLEDLASLVRLEINSCYSLKHLPPGIAQLARLHTFGASYCSHNIVESAQRMLPALRPPKTITDLLEWNQRSEREVQYFKYVEPDVFVPILAHLHVQRAARLVLVGGRGTGKSVTCDHVVDFFTKVQSKHCKPAYPHGHLFFRVGTLDHDSDQAAVLKALRGLHAAMFTRCRAESDSNLWRASVRELGISGEVGSRGADVQEAIKEVKQHIQALLAGLELLLIVDDAGPLLQQLFGRDGCICDSFLGACVATARHQGGVAALPALPGVTAMRSMLTGTAACQRIFGEERRCRYIREFSRRINDEATARHEQELTDEDRQAIEHLGDNPLAAKLVGQLMAWYRSKLHEFSNPEAWLSPAPVMGMPSARTMTSIEQGPQPLLVTFARVMNAIHNAPGSMLECNTHRDVSRLLDALLLFPADTALPRGAFATEEFGHVRDNFRASCVPDVLCFLMLQADTNAWGEYWHDSVGRCRIQVEQCEMDVLEYQEEKPVRPLGCLHIHPCLLDAISSSDRVTQHADLLARGSFQADCALNPSSKLVAACCVCLYGSSGHAQAARHAVSEVPPVEGQWACHWWPVFCELGIDPTWLGELLALTDERVAGGLAQQLLFSAASGRVWPLLLEQVPVALGTCVPAALAVLPLLLCRSSAEEVLWKPEHAGILANMVETEVGKVRFPTARVRDEVSLLCYALASRAVSAAASVAVCEAHLRAQHAQAGRGIDGGVPGCLLFCQLCNGQFEDVLHGEARAVGDSPVALMVASATLGLRRYERAAERARSACDAFEREYGGRHAGVLRCKALTAEAMCAMDDHRAALPISRELAEACTHALGVDHPETSKTRGAVASALAGLGKHQEALRFQEAEARTLHNSLGTCNARSLRWTLRSAATLQHMGDHGAALQRFDLALGQALLACEAGHSGDHCNASAEMLACVRAACRSLVALGQPGRALHAQQVSLQAHWSTLGKAHRGTLELMYDIGCSLVRLNCHAQAVTTVAVALMVCQGQYGKQDPDSLRCMLLLAKSLLQLGETGEAREVLRAAAPLLAEEYGYGSSDAAWCASQLEQPGAEREVCQASLMQLLTTDAVNGGAEAEGLVLRARHAQVPLFELPHSIQILDGPRPSRVGDVTGLRVTRSAPCNPALVIRQLLALQRLELDGVYLGVEGARELSPHLACLTALTAITCSANRLAALGMVAITEALRSLRLLESITVTSNDVGAQGAASLADALRQLPKVTEVGIGGNNVGSAGMDALAGVLGEMWGLCKLDVGENGLGGADIVTLAVSTKGLARVDLSGNDIGVDGAGQVARALQTWSSLTALNLSSNRLGDAGVRAIARAIEGLFQLQDLNLIGNKVGAEGLAALVPHMVSLTALTALHLGGNDLCEAGMQSLASQDARKVLSRLRKLNLHSKFRAEIGPQGAVKLKSSLTTATSLVSLNIGGNMLAKEGTSALAPALKALVHLEELDVCYNRLDGVGARALVDILTALTKLTHLNVEGNRSRKFVIHLVPGLRQLRCLKSLELSSCHIDDTGAKVLAQAFPAIKNLTYLDLFSNDDRIGKQGAAVLGAALTHVSGLAELKLLGIGSDAIGGLAYHLTALSALTHVLINRSNEAPLRQWVPERVIELFM